MHQILPSSSCNLPAFLALPWHPHSCNMKDTQATCHALHQLHNPVVLEELDVIMSKRQVKKKDTLYNRKGRAWCYFIHLWDFIIKFNAIIHLAFSKHILGFSLKILPWQSLRILHICLGFPDVFQPAPY